MGKPRVLILCTHNSARSQMAEGLLRHLAGDRFDVYSAGLEPTQVHPLATRAMAEIGIDIGGQRSKSLFDYLGQVHFGYLITVCSRAEQECPVFPGVSVRLHWPCDDPAAVTGSEEERLDAFRRSRDQIAARLRRWLTEPSSGGGGNAGR
jgi:arsenate reductase (thioredoxin)